MPINFVNLLQDSWNFIRNQQGFFFTSVGILSGLQLFRISVVSSENIEWSLNNLSNLAVLSSLVDILCQILIILNIKAISTGQYRHFFQSISTTLIAFLPVIFLLILSMLPFSVGMASAFVASSTNENPLILYLSFPLLIWGSYVFIKLSLTLYAYLLEEPRKGIFATLSFVWQLSRGKMLILFLYFVLSYVMPFIINWLLQKYTVLTSVSAIIISITTVFVMIFSFRFYQSFRQLNS